MLTISRDRSATMRSSTSPASGDVIIDQRAKTLKIRGRDGSEVEFSIDSAPADNRMTLSGVGYTRADALRPKAAKPVVPDNVQLITLVKTTLNDFSDAVQKEDFRDFHRTLYYELAMQRTPDEMKEAFIDYVRDKDNFNLRKSIAKLDPGFDPAPKIEYVKGLDALVLEGSFQTKPTKTMFSLRYSLEAGTWKLITINIKTAAE